MTKFQEFNEDIEDFESWEERLRFHLVANEVKPEVQAAYLMACMGPKAYKVLKNALYPEQPGNKTYAQLVSVLHEKLKSVTSIFVKRYKFYNRKQEENEKIETFISVLKDLARDCKFSIFLDQALRDRLVCGLLNADTQKKLFGESENLTFKRACEIAINDEATESQRQLICGEAQVNQIYRRQFQKSGQDKVRAQVTLPSKDCFRCGKKHDPIKCPAINWECFICKKKGHTKYVCKYTKNVANIEEENEEFLSYLKHLGSVRSKNSVMVKACLENIEYEFEVDTGACRTVLHIRDFGQIQEICEIKPVQFKLRVATGEIVKIIGETKVNVCINDKWYEQLPIVLIDCKNKFLPLLGRNWLSIVKPGWQKRFSEQIMGTEEINRAEAPLRPWPNANNNFQRVHIDLFRKFNYNFLIWVDSKSKWIDVKFLNNGTTAKEVIIALKGIISVVGLPIELVSNNGQPFNSQEFAKFCQANGINLVKTPPYYPHCNGLAESGVQRVKNGLEKIIPRSMQLLSESEIKEKLAHFLFAYRNTPNTVTGIRPSESVLRMKPRVKFDLIRHPFNGQSSSSLTKKGKIETVRKTKLYSNGETVFVKIKNDRNSVKWEKGKIIRVISFNTYLVLRNGAITHVHRDMLRSAPEERTEVISNDENILPIVKPLQVQQQNTQEYVLPEEAKESIPEVEVAKESTLEVEVAKESKPEVEVAKESKPEVVVAKESKPEVVVVKESKPEVVIAKESKPAAKESNSRQEEEHQESRSNPTVVNVRGSSRISRPPIRYNN